MLLTICCSAESVAMARLLASRLERNLAIVPQVVVGEDPAPILWEEGAISGAVLMLLDSSTAPKPFRRQEWQPLLAHIEARKAPAIGFVRIEECAYPPLIERKGFFSGPEQAERSVERWVIPMLRRQPGLVPDATGADIPAEWWSELVDRPGRLTLPADAAERVQQFAHAAAPHFQSVAWIGCARRTRDAIQGEAEHRVRGDRTLIVLAHERPGLAIAGARCSVIGFAGPRTQRREETAFAESVGACYAPLFPEWLAREIAGESNCGFDAFATVVHDGRRLFRANHVYASSAAARRRHYEIVASAFHHWRSQPDMCRELLYEVPGAADYGFDHAWTNAAEMCQRAAYLLLTEERRAEAAALFQMVAEQAALRGDTAIHQHARHELSWLTGSFDALHSNAGVDPQQMALEF
jgi:hypothetical protein